jgi:hypothetical protein
MAKKNIKKKDHQEVIANCDKSQKDITKSDDLQFEVQNLHLKHDNLEELTYTFRGCHIMIDSDLADIYEVETKYLKRNCSGCQHSNHACFCGDAALYGCKCPSLPTVRAGGTTTNS